MLWLLYQLILGVCLLAISPWLALRRRGHYLRTLPARLGFGKAPPVTGDASLWLHAVSVGEVGVAATFLRAVPRHLPLVISTITPAGQELAQSQLGDRAQVTYLPFELDFPIRRFLRRFSPRILILVEGDLWPLVLHRATSRRIPVVVINGRVSDRGFRRLMALRPLLSPLLSPIDCFAVQGQQDRERLLKLGVVADRIQVTGNLKFDTPQPETRPELQRIFQGLSAGRPTLIAGSTMAREEEQVLEAFERLRTTTDALLILAPRHPDRWDEVAGLLDKRGLSFRRRSELQAEAVGPPTLVSIVLLDSLGELAGLYGIADAAFIGGTLVDTGGHNPLEAARFGVPIVVGPFMGNFRDVSRLFDDHDAWSRVRDANDLAAIWKQWLDEPQDARAQGARGRLLVETNRGATARTVEIVKRHLREDGW